MNSYVLGFHKIHKTKLAIVGGKGTNLGELSRIQVGGFFADFTNTFTILFYMRELL